MKASRQTLKKFIKGALTIRDEGAYICPLKYEEEQIEMFHQADPGWYWRSQFSSGTRIELMTDATELRFDYNATDFSSSDCTFDLYIDGVLKCVHKVKKFNFDRAVYTMREGWKLVQIYLPVDCHIGIKNFNINGAYKSAKDKGQKVLIIGDSITQGYGSMFSSGSYFNELQRQTGYNMLNQGIGGYRCEPQDLMYVDSFEPDKIITFLGTNWYDAPDQYDYEKSTIGFYKRLTELYPDKQILSISPIWRGNDDLDVERFTWCRSIVKRECERYENINFVDGFTLIPNVLDCYCDKVHPNEYGCYMLATNIHKEMKKVKF